MLAKTTTRILVAFLLAFSVGACMLAASLEQAHAASATTTTVKVGSKSFKMALAKGEPAQAFRAYLKKARTLKMSELNGNEKYRYFSNKQFPTAEKRYKKVRAGDVMLYDDDCLVIFYKTHKTSYSYTKVGRLTSTKGLAKAAGKKSVKVRFAKMKQAAAKGKASRAGGVAAPVVQPEPSQPAAAGAPEGSEASGGSAPDGGDVASGGAETGGSSSAETSGEATGEGGADQVEAADGDAADADPAPSQPVVEAPTSEPSLALSVNGREVQVTWADNDAARALAALAAASPVVVEAHAYGGFEQVGALPKGLPASNSQITTKPGDIVLYQGNQVCVFHGSNTWSYTPLGHIEGLADSELTSLLGVGGVTLAFSMTG